MSSNQSTRASRQAEADAKNAAAAAAFEAASNPSGGALGRGGFGDPRNASSGTNIDLTSPAGRFLADAYRQSGIVIDPRTNNIIYNPADLGAAEIERTRALRGQAPSSQTRGNISRQFQERVEFASGGKTKELRSQSEQLDKARAETQSRITDTKTKLQSLIDYANTRQGGKGGADLSIQANQRQLERLQKDLENIDRARSTVAQAESKARGQAAREFFTDTFDPVKQVIQETPRVTPQRQRAKIQTDQPASQFTNPNFVTKSQQRQRDQAKQDLSFSGVLDNVGLVANPLPQAFAEPSQDLTTIREQNKARIDSIKETISKAKETGATEITITSESGFTKTVPISSAYREVIKASTNEPVSILAQGASQSTILPPEIPGGTVLVGSIASPFLLEERPSKVGPGISSTLKAAKESGLGILQPVTSFLDAEFELNKPKEQRSERNRIIGEVTAPLSNLVGLGVDASKQIGGLIKGEEVFDPNTRAGFLNLPQAKPQYVTEPQRTTLGDLIEGRPVDFKSPFTQASLAGEAVLFGLPVLGGKAGGKVAKVTTERKQVAQDIKQIKSDLAEAVPPQTTEIRPFGSPESALNPKTRASDIIQSNLENVIGKPLTTKNKIRVKKTGTDTFDIESTNPLSERIVTARKVGKKEFVYETLENPAGAGGKPTGIDVFGTLGKAEQKKFGLIPTQQQNKFVSKGAPADLAEQLASDIVKPVARQKTFTSQQVREGGPEFGAFFFGKTRPGFTPSTTPLSDLLLFETRYSRLAGTRVGTAPALKSEPGRLDIRPDVFQGIRERTIRSAKKRFVPDFISGEKFTKKQVTDSFVFDVRQASKGQIDPFADLTKFDSPQNMLAKMLGIKPKGKTKSFSRGEFAVTADENLPMTGKAKAITRQELKETQERFLPKESKPQKPREDAFGTIPIVDLEGARADADYSLEIRQSVLEPKTITKRRPTSEFVERIESERLDTIQRLAQGGGSEIVDPLRQRSDRKPSTPSRNVPRVDPFQGSRSGLNVIPDLTSILQTPRTAARNPTSTRTGSGTRTIEDLVPKFDEVLTPIQGQVPKQKTRLREQQITDITTPTLFPPRLRPPRTTETGEFIFPRGKLPFLFPGGSGGDGKGGKRGKKSFTVFSVGDVGVLEQVGVPTIQTSYSPEIFGKIDIQLEKAKTKEKKRKKGRGILSGTETGPISRATNEASIRAGRQIGKRSRTAPRSLRNGIGGISTKKLKF